MNSYFLIIIADILLTITFVIQKKYQLEVGVSAKTNLAYTVISGLFSAILFLAINGFKIRATWFSLVMAIAFSVVVTAYTLIGFRVMEKGSMSIYTLFLMSGGMTVPYIYGVLFLGEELTFIRTLGLLLMITAITAVNFTKGKTDKEQIFLCIAVFLINGASSVISKVHQISPASEMVSSSDFVFLVMAVSSIIGMGAMLLVKEKKESKKVKSGSLKFLILLIFLGAVANGISYMLQLMGAVDLPATVLYPLITGGTIILSSLADFIIFKEKLSLKQWSGVGIAFLGTFMFL